MERNHQLCCCRPPRSLDYHTLQLLLGTVHLKAQLHGSPTGQGKDEGTVPSHAPPHPALHPFMPLPHPALPHPHSTPQLHKRQGPQSPPPPPRLRPRSRCSALRRCPALPAAPAPSRPRCHCRPFPAQAAQQAPPKAGPGAAPQAPAPARLCRSSQCPCSAKQKWHCPGCQARATPALPPAAAPLAHSRQRQGAG